MFFSLFLVYYNHGQIHWDSTAFYISHHFLSQILVSFATPSPPFNVAWGKIVCRAESGPVYAQHWMGGEGGGFWGPKNVHWTEINASVPKKFVHDCSSSTNMDISQGSGSRYTLEKHSFNQQLVRLNLWGIFKKS